MTSIKIPKLVMDVDCANDEDSCRILEQMSHWRIPIEIYKQVKFTSIQSFLDQELLVNLNFFNPMTVSLVAAYLINGLGVVKQPVLEYTRQHDLKQVVTEHIHFSPLIELQTGFVIESGKIQKIIFRWAN